MQKKHDKYLNEISKHHSIAVMDKEVRKFLKKFLLTEKLLTLVVHGVGIGGIYIKSGRTFRCS